MPPLQVPIAVLASGRGSNLQALMDALHESGPGRIALVVSDRTDAPALDRARNAGIPAHHVAADGRASDGLLALFAAHQIGLVVLAGYLKRVPTAVVAALRGRILNVHPALLPGFGGPGMYGRRVQEAVLASGARLSGATVHVVDEQYDHGPIVAQWPVPVKHGDTPESLAARILEIEHLLLPAVVAAFCRRLRAGTMAPPSFAPAGDAFVLGIPPTDLSHALLPD